MKQLAFVGELALELSRVHSVRRVVEVLFASLVEHAAVREVLLWCATGEGGGVETVCTETGARRTISARPSFNCALAGVVALPDDAGHLAIRSPGQLDRELLLAIAAVVVTSIRHVEVLERVAKLSRRAHLEARDLRHRLDEMERVDPVIAASPSTKRLLREVVPAVARHDTTVLLRGPTGTGKEVLARRIHALSKRNSRAFVQINCGAIPETLIESTLFGHERGSFTGATARHAGVFERAHLGTLLLDEVGDLPPSAQVKLLRVLQSGEMERVGGDRSVKVDVRVIAATNRPLETMVAAGTFRADLYYRLSVFPIELLPLRQRPEDIDALTTMFVARAAARMGRRPPVVPEPVRKKLRRHTWPGNVRELENVVERALVLCASDDLRLPFSLDGPLAQPRKGDEVEPLHAATKRAIARALVASHGRIYGAGGAAALLGLKPTTLQSKMIKMGIPREG